MSFQLGPLRLLPWAAVQEEILYNHIIEDRYFGWLWFQFRYRVSYRCPHHTVIEGGGSHFGDDLWTCQKCGLQKYPENFPDRQVRRVLDRNGNTMAE